MPITIPKHEPIKKVYVEMVRQIVESEAKLVGRQWRVR